VWLAQHRAAPAIDNVAPFPSKPTRL